MAAVRSTGQGQGGQNCKPVVAAGPQDRVGSRLSVSEVIESIFHIRGLHGGRRYDHGVHVKYMRMDSIVISPNILDRHMSVLASFVSLTKRVTNCVCKSCQLRL